MHFSDAIAISVSGWVSAWLGFRFSDFGESYRIYQACELVFPLFWLSLSTSLDVLNLNVWICQSYIFCKLEHLWYFFIVNVCSLVSNGQYSAKHVCPLIVFNYRTGTCPAGIFSNILQNRAIFGNFLQFTGYFLQITLLLIWIAWKPKTMHAM